MRLRQKLLFVIMLFICSSYASDAFAIHLTGSGCAISYTGYLSELVKEYERKTGVKIYLRSGGTTVGLEDLQKGAVDFAAACRPRQDFDPKDVEFIQVAWDALVFIVHKSNTIDNITPQDVREIYSAKMTNWRKLKGSDASIKLFVSKHRMGLAGVYHSTKEIITNGMDVVETPNTLLVASAGIVEQMVERTSEGFGISGFSSARKRDVKMLKVNGVYPTKKDIINNKYPFKRPLFLVALKNPKPEVKRFIDFTLSKEGQRLISSLGTVSLLDVK